MLNSPLFLFIIVAVFGFATGLGAEFLLEGEMSKVQQLIMGTSFEIHKISILKSAELSTNTQSILEQASIGFDIIPFLQDPDSIPDTEDEFFVNGIDACRFHAAENIEHETCIICTLIDWQGEEVSQGRIDLPEGYTASDTLEIPITDFELVENIDVKNIEGTKIGICLQKAGFIIIDEDSIDNDDEPFTTTPCYEYLDPTMFTSNPGCGEFTDTAPPVNANLSLSPGVRKELPFFDNNVGKIIELQVGHITDEGWFAPQIIPQSWIDAGPTDDGIRNFVGVMNMPGGPLVPGDGLGSGNDPEIFLDNIPDVRPIRYEGVLGLIGMDLCAVVHDSDISINYLNPNPPGGVEDGNLQGNYKGIVAFRILQVIPFVDDSPFAQGQDPQEIAKVKIGILDAKNDEGTGVCQGNLFTYEAPFIVDEDTPFDSGYNADPTPTVSLPFP